jgi:hypothetical protein
LEERLIIPLPEGMESTAKVMINGEEIPDVRILELETKFLTVSYGFRPAPDNFPGIILFPPGGGGSVYLVVSEIPATGEPIFLAILENRPNMGGLRWCAPGGGKFETEGTHCSIGKKSFANKIGLTAEDIHFEKLPGLHGNKDRLFEKADPTTSGEGVHFYWGTVPFSMLEEVPGGWEFKGGTAPAELIKSGKVAGMRFLRYQDYISSTGDVTAICLAAKYIAWALENKKIKWV